LKGIFSLVPWLVEYTDEFGTWWDTLTEGERIRITASVGLLERRGPNLPFPHSSGSAVRVTATCSELRVQIRGRPIRIFYAFDPRRIAILLIGGDKTGQDDFYAMLIPLADRLCDEHLAAIAAERSDGGNDGGHAFGQLRAGLSVDSQRKAAALTEDMEQTLSLSELRRARAMTQEQLAADLHVGQASIAKLERRTDMYLSTLRRFVEAMGGELDIVARFPDQPQVRLRGIGELAEVGDVPSAE
jgi:hypothetical protein